jgi:hypothetical protein
MDADAGTLGGKCMRDRRTDATACSCNKHTLAAESGVHEVGRYPERR